MPPRRNTKKNPLPCNEDQLARKFLFDEIAEGRVTPEMGSRSVHNNYKDRVRSFKFPGMEYSSTFASRLAGLRKIVTGDISQASDDKQALAIAICKHPPPTHKSRSEPQWNVSDVQILLDDDIEVGNHLRTNPKELHETRDKYKWFKPATF